MKAIRMAQVICIMLAILLSACALADSGTFVDPIFTGVTSNSKGLGGNTYTDYVGGGIWDHGTSYYIDGLTKTAYSNYYHASLEHRSSCRVGSRYSYSPYVSAGSTSFSQTYGPLEEPSQAWWSTDPQ